MDETTERTIIEGQEFNTDVPREVRDLAWREAYGRSHADGLEEMLNTFRQLAAFANECYMASHRRTIARTVEVTRLNATIEALRDDVTRERRTSILRERQAENLKGEIKALQLRLDNAQRAMQENDGLIAWLREQLAEAGFGLNR
jgi:hypothetical protein